MSISVLSLFDGISAGQVALNRAGIKYDNYFASEIDSDAISVTQKNYPGTIQIGDVRNINYSALPKIDLILGGSPCQGFSMAGKKLNFDDPRSVLFFEFYRAVQLLKPQYFLLENTKMKDVWSDEIDCFMKVPALRINSSLMSAQRRDRLYWTNIPNVKPPIDRGIMLKDLIGPYDGIYVRKRGNNKGGVFPYGGKSPTLTSSSWQHNFFYMVSGNQVRFKATDAEQLQTLPIGYTDNLSENRRFRCLGNAFTPDIVGHILSYIV